MNLNDAIVADHETLTRIRRDIHRHPELGFEEERTSELVAKELSELGIVVHRGLGKTGVVGSLSCGSGQQEIALRADMDALAMQEMNAFDHVSVNDGRMHGCGHDGHTAMLLGAARHLAKSKDFNGTIHFVFQPAEEGLGGADEMIRDGLFEKFPADNVWGMHNYPTVPVGCFITRTGPMLACSDTIIVNVQGKGGHGALPHLARNPINVACDMISALNDFIAQEIDTHLPTTFTACRITGGDAINVIPETVEFAGTMRTFTNEVREQFEQGLHRICDGIAAAKGVGVDVKYRRNYPPLVNTPRETDIAARAAANVVGAANVEADCRPIMGSEDFAFMLEKKPGNYIMIGNGDGELGGCMVHNPHYDFNDEILTIGASYWVSLVHELLPQ